MYARVSSIRMSYRTPEGQAVTQAMHPRQRSKCAATVAVISVFPVRSPRIRSMRPRGESISSPQFWYVGQPGRQNPQWTQSSISSRCGAVMRGTFRGPAPRQDRDAA